MITLGYARDAIPQKERYAVDLITSYESYGNSKRDTDFFPVDKQTQKVKSTARKGLMGFLSRFRRGKKDITTPR